MSSERPPYIEQLRAEIRGVPYRPRRQPPPSGPPPDPEAHHHLFTIADGNRWMELGQREPPAQMLFGELWHQRELCILFAVTNVGKSILAVQIADSISRSRPIATFACNDTPTKVVYIDFELSTTQFYQRYSHAGSDYEFSPNFFRAQFNHPTEIPGNYTGYDHFLIAGIEYKVQLAKATVLIIDNITALRAGTENASVALKLMQSLKALARDYHLSILVLAHTPKRRNAAQPLSVNDLHGSKLLINFADSAFAIGKSNTDAGLCYLKQIKQRNTQQLYGEGNVCLCRIEKLANKLHFEFEGTSTERPHLLSSNAAHRAQLAKQVARLSASGLSQRQISEQLKIALGTVNNLMRLGVQMGEDASAQNHGLSHLYRGQTMSLT